MARLKVSYGPIKSKVSVTRETRASRFRTFLSEFVFSLGVFYEAFEAHFAFGGDVGDEVVEWFLAVDASEGLLLDSLARTFYSSADFCFIHQ